MKEFSREELEAALILAIRFCIQGESVVPSYFGYWESDKKEPGRECLLHYEELEVNK